MNYIDTHIMEAVFLTEDDKVLKADGTLNWKVILPSVPSALHVWLSTNYPKTPPRSLLYRDGVSSLHLEVTDDTGTKEVDVPVTTKVVTKTKATTLADLLEQAQKDGINPDHIARHYVYPSNRVTKVVEEVAIDGYGPRKHPVAHALGVLAFMGLLVFAFFWFVWSIAKVTVQLVGPAVKATVFFSKFIVWMVVFICSIGFVNLAGKKSKKSHFWVLAILFVPLLLTGERAYNRPTGQLQNLRKFTVCSYRPPEDNFTYCLRKITYSKPYTLSGMINTDLKEREVVTSNEHGVAYSNR